MKSASKYKELSCLRANVSVMTAMWCMLVYRHNYLIDVCQMSILKKTKRKTDTQFWATTVAHTSNPHVAPQQFR